ncbi:MAG: SAM-dependent methyltransferase, partial [Nitrospirae bacterium]|nr:SAM-dependent methyltransferase [Nitrospirota bacterium]
MGINLRYARELLREADLQRLFVEELGWEPCYKTITLTINDTIYSMKAIAEKKGFVVWVYESPDDILPERDIRLKLDRKLSEVSFEHLIVFITSDKTRQLWMWVKREPGRPMRARSFVYEKTDPGDHLLQKLQHLYISLEEEESGISITHVASRAKAAFDVEKVTKRFYDRFKKEHNRFLEFIEGIPAKDDRQWYASVMLNRLMFLYFIQKKGFLDGDIDYLRNRLKMVQQLHGRDRFYSFYRYFLLRLFHEGLNKTERSPELESLIGKVPFINGGIFDVHPIESTYEDIQIPDEAFEAIFDYFDEYDWVLDPERTRKGRSDKEEINPDVLGYIFEKYINQKQMGAYYTKEDITEYISKNTIIPYIFEQAKAKCRVAFENPGGPTVWDLLKENPDRYIYPALKHGITWDVHTDSPLEKSLPLPEEIAQGINPPTLHQPVGEVSTINEVETIRLRRNWNKPAPPEYALPTEIWREVVARRQRYEEVRTKLVSGEVRDIHDLITLNLDIQQFAQDVIANCEGPELLRALWHAIKDIKVLDPTCGSGAFLFAAMNILEPLYEACLDRMEEMLKEEAAKYYDTRVKYTPHGYPELPHGRMKDFTEILEKVASHPNRPYFIFKNIILNNLYGVDIMEEAVEICKLRLFLKLAAQVEPDPSKPNFGIEPLPDIDYNIRTGNTLVGFANYKQVLKSAEGHLLRQQEIEQIKLKAKELQQFFDSFRHRQLEGDGTVPYKLKKELRHRLAELNHELNHYLAGVYGIDPEKKREDYASWLKTHQPFHWFVEFYGIIHDMGGFDVIIGNPPYVEYTKVKDQYTIKNYQTEKCGNLYAFVVERSINLIHEKGFMGMIVPISLPSTPRMSYVRNILSQKSKYLWCSNFADRPGTLFNGVHQKLSIIINQKDSKKQCVLFTTSYRHWYSKNNKNERLYLMELVKYLQAI